MSSSLLYIWLKENYPNVKVQPIFHNKSKAHTLNDVLDDLLQLEPSLLFIPDAGTNDTEECKVLSEKGWKIVILDHHQISQKNPFATIINCQQGNVNKNLSGTGVVWHFCNYCIPFSVDDLISYVMISIISDSMSMVSNENLTFANIGKKNISKIIYPLIKEFNKDIETNKDYAFGLISKINAVIRYGDNQDKEDLFYILSGEKECNQDYLKDMAKIHRKQNNDKNSLVDEMLSNNIANKDDNFIITLTNQSSALNGLCANTILNKERKTIFVLTYNKKDKTYSGSVRSNINNFRNLLIESNLFIYNLGHNQAFGTSFKEKNLSKIKQLLKSITANYKPVYDVLMSSNIECIPNEVYSLVEPYRHIYGQDIPIPEIHIKPFVINGRDIVELGKNKTTIKFSKNDIDFIMFFVGKDKKELLNVGKNKDFKIEIIGEPNINEYNGKKTNQVVINQFEIHEIIEDDGWGDCDEDNYW